MVRPRFSRPAGGPGCGARMKVDELLTPALIADRAGLQHNIAPMAAALPGDRLRPHVKAHKTTALAQLQAAAGHRNFTGATVPEVEGMPAAGLGDDLMLANEILDATRLPPVDARCPLPPDSLSPLHAPS